MTPDEPLQPAPPRLAGDRPTRPAPPVTDPLAGRQEPQPSTLPHLTFRQRVIFWAFKRNLEGRINRMGKNWRTTASGAVTFVYAAAAALKAMLDNDPATVPDWNLVLVAAGALVGLLHAKDRQVTGGTVQQ